MPLLRSRPRAASLTGLSIQIPGRILERLSACSSIRNHAARLNQISHWLMLHTYPEPQLEIQQAPDAIAVVAMACHVLGEQAPEGFGAKESAVERSWFHQQALQAVLKRSRKPIGPRRGKSHLFPINN